MAEGTIFQSGLEGKSDLVATLDLSSPSLEILVESSVQKLFGKKIRETAEKAAKEFGLSRGKLHIKDDGALDFVIWARIEAVIHKSKAVSLPKPLPMARDKGQQDRLRRTRLYIPGNQPDLMMNAGLFGADSLILDLEDSVAPAQKSDARILVRRAMHMASKLFPQGEIIVRINPLSTPFGHDDLEEMIPACPDVLLLPKCDTAEDVLTAEREIAKIEEKYKLFGRTLLMPLIETARGVENAYQIASASKRNVALCFGAEDYTRDLGIKRSREGTETLHARSRIVIAAKSAGIEPIDTVFSDVADEQGLLNSCLEAKSLGFCGKGVIHPRQVPIVHRAFAPTEEEVSEAQKIVAALHEAERTGSGVIALGSKMVDAPVAERARKLLDLARKMGMKVS